MYAHDLKFLIDCKIKTKVFFSHFSRPLCPIPHHGQFCQATNNDHGARSSFLFLSAIWVVYCFLVVALLFCMFVVVCGREAVQIIFGPTPS